jgi:hypothetical protein
MARTWTSRSPCQGKLAPQREQVGRGSSLGSTVNQSSGAGGAKRGGGATVLVQNCAAGGRCAASLDSSLRRQGANFAPVGLVWRVRHFPVDEPTRVGGGSLFLASCRITAVGGVPVVLGLATPQTMVGNRWEPNTTATTRRRLKICTPWIHYYI